MPCHCKLYRGNMKKLLKRIKDNSKFEYYIGIAPITLKQWKTGFSRPRLSSLKKVAETLNLSYGWLTTGKGNKRPKKKPIKEPKPTKKVSKMQYCENCECEKFRYQRAVKGETNLPGLGQAFFELERRERRSRAFDQIDQHERGERL